MTDKTLIDQFCETARRVGAKVLPVADAAGAAAYIQENADGTVLLPASPSLERFGLAALLSSAGLAVTEGDLRPAAPSASAGVTGVNFALADTGSVVLESTDEAVRLASTLPERHFVLLDPSKILADGFAAIPYLRQFREKSPRHFLAYITGPSRTADIERVLTIGVHGPKELHILLMERLSSDFMEL
jgi:L-lactate dehydrogenase complex protein LldG